MKQFIFGARRARYIALSVMVVVLTCLVFGVVAVALQRNTANKVAEATGTNTQVSAYDSPNQKSTDTPAPENSQAQEGAKDGSSSTVSEDKTTPSTSSGQKNAAASGTTNTNNPSATQPSYQPVPPNPYCPTPTFSLSVTAQPNSTNLILTANASMDDPNLKPECGGGYNYFWPVVTEPINGSLCSGTVYSIGSNNSWGVACAIYGNVPYGVYTYSFTVTASNGYAKTASRTTSYTFNYSQQ